MIGCPYFNNFSIHCFINTDSLCDIGWKSFNGSCYIGGSEHPKRNYQSAQNYCNDRLSNLVSSNNSQRFTTRESKKDRYGEMVFCCCSLSKKSSWTLLEIQNFQKCFILGQLKAYHRKQVDVFFILIPKLDLVDK